MCLTSCDSYGSRPPEELEAWSSTVFIATAFGFLFGGLIGARRSGDKYIAMNHNTKYQHPMQAHVSVYKTVCLFVCLYSTERDAQCSCIRFLASWSQVGLQDGSLRCFVQVLHLMTFN